MKLRFSLAAVLALTILSACSSNSVKDSDNPEVIYKAALKFIDDEDYLEATEHLNEIRHRFPQSRFAALTELATGDMEFKQENWPEAAAAYKVFVELYPNHASASYAQYRRAQAYYNDTPDNVARDQTPAKDAIDASEQLLKRYPGSKEAKDARALIVQARHKLAQKEAYIARFYERREAWLAARHRWEGIVKDYADLKSDAEMKDLYEEASRRSRELESKG